MKKYVLDTNLFFNLQAQSQLGSNSKEVFETLTDYIQKLRASKVATFFIPPTIKDEICTFVNEDDEYIKNFLAEIEVKAPEKSNMSFSASAFYDIVNEIRKRSYRGLQIAEEEMDAAVKSLSATGELSKIEYQKQFGEHVSRLRDRYRNATRVKFLDSSADLDLIVLAKEIDGAVVSADEGVMLWARKFGVKEVAPDILKKQLDSLLLA